MVWQEKEKCGKLVKRSNYFASNELDLFAWLLYKHTPMECQVPFLSADPSSNSHRFVLQVILAISGLGGATRGLLYLFYFNHFSSQW